MKNVLLNMLLWCILFSSCNNESEIENERCFLEYSPDTFDFPIKPGTPEWAELNSGEEMIAAVQIPDSILSVMTTEGMIESVLTYPLFYDIYLREDHQYAFNLMKTQFNGLKYLLKRNDAALKLFDRYKLMHPGCNTNNWPSIIERGGNPSFSFAAVEILIAQWDILSQLNNYGQTKALLKEAINKYELKNKNSYSDLSKKHTALILGRILYLERYSPFIEEWNKDNKIRDFTEAFASAYNVETLIYYYAKDFLKEKK